MGMSYFAPSVVLTKGTFLNGLIHIGEKTFGGGRLAEKRGAERRGWVRNLFDRFVSCVVLFLHRRDWMAAEGGRSGDEVGDGIGADRREARGQQRNADRGMGGMGGRGRGGGGLF
jgi:hypothetical protein